MKQFNIYDFLYEAVEQDQEDVEQENQMDNNFQAPNMGNQNPQMGQENPEQTPDATPQQVGRDGADSNPFRHIVGSTISDMKWKQKGQDWVLSIKVSSSNLPLIISSRGGTITASGPVPQDPKSGNQVTVLSQER